MEADLFSSSPARPSHHRTQLPVQKPNGSSSSSANKRNPLKRTASAAALLTPPGSPEKDKARSAKRSFSDSDDEDEDVEMASPSAAAKPKRRAAARANIATKERRAMNRFGGGRQESIVFPRGRTATSTTPKAAKANMEPVREEADRMCLDTSPLGSPASPEQPRTPRRGRSAGPVHPVPSLLLPAAPTTPTRKSTRRAGMPVRDSPNNPFLVSSSPPTKSKAKAKAVSHEKLEELPTMTYVFRGVKAVFKNPGYTGPEPEAGRHGRIALHPSHRDFSPDLMAAPKLLFPPTTADSDDEKDVAPIPSTSRQRAPITPPSSTRATKRRRVNEEGARARKLNL